MEIRYLRWVWLASLVWAIVAAPKAAESIPVFANGQGTSCDLCHSAPPNLNAYGRYILATNFAKGLDPHKQMSENLKDPVSLEVTGAGSNTPNPMLPKVYVDLVQGLAGGFFGQDVSYYASVPIVEGGFPANAIDQVWGAYNGFFSKTGSLQVGKFPTPVFAPWLSQSLSLAGYTLAAMPVGLNSVGVGDNRWGTSYTQIGSKGLIGNVAYVTNTGSAERAFDGDIDSGGEGQSYVGSLQFMAPSSHFTGGIAAIGGTFPLPSGAKDNYNRAMGLLSYSTSPKYSLTAMALVGYDSNPNDGASTSSGSNGLSFEAIYTPVKWLHLDARYERTNDGLGTIANNYVTDIAFSIMPNLIATVENVSAVGARPVMSYQLMWVGPWIRHSAPQVVAAANAASPDGRQIYAANCAACHGASGGGGVGPSLHGIAARKSLDQTVSFIESPAGLMPKLYPAALSEAQVQAVAAYIRDTFH
jgi:mono/diheme cytochrome c family protein